MGAKGALFTVGSVLATLGLLILINTFSLTDRRPRATEGLRQEAILRGSEATEAFRRRLRGLRPVGYHFSRVAACEPEQDYRRLCLTVRPRWHRMDFWQRKTAATEVWRLWAEVCRGRGIAEHSNNCRITLLSPSGRTIGGSRLSAGASIWVAAREPS